MIRVLRSHTLLHELELEVSPTSPVPPLGPFCQKLLHLLPSLKAHKCMAGEDGGFLKELEEGTNLAHVVEHVALELQHLADPEHRVYTGWTKTKRDPGGRPIPGLYLIHFQTRNSQMGDRAGKMAAEIVNGLLEGREVRLNGYLETLRRLARKESQDGGTEDPMD